MKTSFPASSSTYVAEFSFPETFRLKMFKFSTSIAFTLLVSSAVALPSPTANNRGAQSVLARLNAAINGHRALQGTSCPSACCTHNNAATYGVCTDWVSSYGWGGTSPAHQVTNCTGCQPNDTCGGGGPEPPAADSSDSDDSVVPPSADSADSETPLDNPRPVCTVDPVTHSASEQISYDCPVSDTPMVLYAGGAEWDYTFAWDHARHAHVDILMLAFLTYWNEPCADAPADLGSIGVPMLNTNGFPNASSSPAKCGHVHLNPTMNPDGSAEDEILRAQASGQRIILSVGGQNANSNDMNPEKGRDLAHALWEMFLGGTAAEWQDMRPLGRRVVLDGIDLDLEQSPEDCPWGAVSAENPMGPDCQAVAQGWLEFVNTLRAYMDADTRKRYLLTAVPINSKQFVNYPGYGSHVQGFMNTSNCDETWLQQDEAAKQALLDAMYEGYLAHAEKLDFIWAQFYPSPSTITMQGSCWEADLVSWAYICERAGEASKCRAGVGLPISANGAAGGQVEPSAYLEQIKGAIL